MKTLDLALAAIQMDTSIQCRAAIDKAIVNDYALDMSAGFTFPPIEVYGTTSRCWIGDGWHRAGAVQSRGLKTISAHLNPGGRADALKHALKANATHGHRRSNEDKRRAIEIALREFPKLSGRAIARLCGVDNKTVEAVRPAVEEVPHVARTGRDGKQYPARRTQPAPDAPERIPDEAPDRPIYYEPPPGAHAKLGPPSNGMQYARMAIMDLEQITDKDVEREEGLAHVGRWLDSHAGRPGAKGKPTPSEQAMGQARLWMRRWGHVNAFAEICSAITDAIERHSRRESTLAVEPQAEAAP